MTLTQMEYVVALAQTGSFSKASQKCFVTQPTLSVQIQKLERELEVILFDRSVKPIQPTWMGQKIVEQCKIVLKEKEVLSEIVAREKSSLQGELRIAILPTLAPYLSPLFAVPFHRRYPQVRLHVLELPTLACLERLEAEEIDCAILATQEKESFVLQEKLGEEELFLFVNARHALHQKTKISLSDLETKDLWLLEEGHCLRNEVLDLCQKRKKESDSPYHLTYEVGSLEALKYFVMEQVGYTFFPKLAVDKLSSSESLFIRPFEKPAPFRTLWFTTSEKALKTKLLEALRKELQQILQEHLS